MKLAYQIERLAPIWPQIVAIATEHWKETEGYRHGQTFQPDAARYFQYEAIGFYVMFTARDEGRLVGYAGCYFTPSMHTQQLLCTEDTWFLLPEYRRGRNALEFYNFVEAECRRRGVVEIGMTAKLTNSAGRILEYLGYQVVSKQYSKHLSYNQSPAQSRVTPSQGCADSAIGEENLMESSNVRTQPTASAPAA